MEDNRLVKIMRDESSIGRRSKSWSRKRCDDQNRKSSEKGTSLFFFFFFFLQDYFNQYAFSFPVMLMSNSRTVLDAVQVTRQGIWFSIFCNFCKPVIIYSIYMVSPCCPLREQAMTWNGKFIEEKDFISIWQSEHVCTERSANLDATRRDHFKDVISNW